ncbi:MAG: right-handed parallel beta-helix repeat-containing protein [Planctomycetota bacterium]
MQRDEALTLLRLTGAPSSDDVETAFFERQYEIEQKRLTAGPEEGAGVAIDFEMGRIHEAKDVLIGTSVPEGSARPDGFADGESGPTASGMPGGIGVDTVKLSLPPGAALPGTGGSSRLKTIGGWAVRVLALLAVLAGIFVYLTHFGPLTSWWNQVTRDGERETYARSLKAESETLQERWTTEAGLLRVERPAEIEQAQTAIERGDRLFAECRDELAITAFLEAKGRYEVGLGELGHVRAQLVAQGESTGGAILQLFKEIEKAEWSFDRRERDASEEVQRTGESLKAARSRDDRRGYEREFADAKGRLALARDLQEVCRRMVFASDRLPRIQEEIGDAMSALTEEDVHDAVERLDELKSETEALLELSEELERTVRELWSCEQFLTDAKARAPSEERALFTASVEALASLREKLGAKELEAVRSGLPAVRASVSETERILPVRGEAARHAERLTATQRFPELAEELAVAMATHRSGDEHLLAGRRSEAGKAYGDAARSLKTIEADLKNALVAKVKEAAEEDIALARAVLEDLLRLDPLDADAIALKKRLSGKREPRGIIVPDTAGTLQEAMRAAKAGEVIRIRPGVYEGGFTFKEGVRIEGAGADKVTLRCGAKDGNVITVLNCRSGSISGVTLEHLGTDLDDHRYSGLHVENSSIQLSDLTVRNAAGSGVLLTKGGKTTVADCLIEGSGWFGICYTAGGGGRATGNECRRNGFSGIAVISKARSVDVTGNECRNNGLHGIYFGEGTSGRAVGNTAERNRGNGIAVRGPYASPRVSGNRCLDNRQFGIYLDGGAGGTLENNTCSENDYSGIGAVGTSADFSLRKNICVGNRRDGIYLYDKARGTVEENLCERNEDSGIAAIGTHADLALRRNRCLSNRTWGIYFGGGAGGRAEGNVCERNTRDGIAVAEARTTTTIRANRCTANHGDGIHFAKGTGGTAEGNVCAQNQGYGLYADSGSSVRVSSTTGKDNGMGDLGGKAKK